jgi:hypothetical protein
MRELELLWSGGWMVEGRNSEAGGWVCLLDRGPRVATKNTNASIYKYMCANKLFTPPTACAMQYLRRSTKQCNECNGQAAHQSPSCMHHTSDDRRRVAERMTAARAPRHATPKIDGFTFCLQGPPSPFDITSANHLPICQLLSLTKIVSKRKQAPPR